MCDLLEILQRWIAMRVGIIYRSVTARCIGIKSWSLIAAIELVEPEIFEETVLYGGERGGLVKTAEV